MNTQDLLDRYDFITDARKTLPRHPSRTWRRRDVDGLRGMVWHQALSAGTARGVARYHTAANHIDPRGLPAISYTFYVESNGVVLLCNDLEDVTYSQGDRTRPGDENRLYMAACFSGNFDAPGYRGTVPVTAQQLSAGLQLWLACSEAFRWSGLDLFGHYHMGKSTCPGTVLGQVIEAVRSASRPYRADRFATAGDKQRALRRLGFYSGSIDNDWGIESRRALAQYQASRDLTVDGIWGPETQEAMSREA